MALALATALTAPPAWAFDVTCLLSGPTCPTGAVCDGSDVALSFSVDTTHFAPARNAGEPPRRAATMVTLGGTRFVAAPFAIGSTIGFHEDAGALGQRMFSVGGTGRALYEEEPSGITLEGRCEVTR